MRMLPTGSDGNPAGNSAKMVCRSSPAFSTLPFHLQSISLERRWCALAAVVLLGLHDDHGKHWRPACRDRSCLARPTASSVWVGGRPLRSRGAVRLPAA